MASELEEKDFVQNGGPKFLWIFLCLFILGLLLFWGIRLWQENLFEKKEEFPFYQVTNRQFSIFLWQHPYLMRERVDFKVGYLPYFVEEHEMYVLPKFADVYVTAPSEILFRYHVWSRLIGDSLAPRPIPANEFLAFIHSDRQWLPEFWPEAPNGYAELVEGLGTWGAKDLQDALPYDVRLAFQGWRNFFKEWEQIRSVHPTVGQMSDFLLQYPRYGRSYWRNILQEEIPDYLIHFKEGAEGNREDVLSESELSDFLRIAFFNFVVSHKPVGINGPLFSDL